MVFLVKYKSGLPLPSFALYEMIFLPLSLKGWATSVSSYTAAPWYKYLLPLIEQLNWPSCLVWPSWKCMFLVHIPSILYSSLPGTSPVMIEQDSRISEGKMQWRIYSSNTIMVCREWKSSVLHSCLYKGIKFISKEGKRQGNFWEVKAH